MTLLFIDALNIIRRIHQASTERVIIWSTDKDFLQRLTDQSGISDHFKDPQSSIRWQSITGKAGVGAAGGDRTHFPVNRTILSARQIGCDRPSAHG